MFLVVKCRETIVTIIPFVNFNPLELAYEVVDFYPFELGSEGFVSFCDASYG